MLPNRITALIVTTLLVIGCASSPTGRPQLAFKSEREMRQMGEQAFTQIKAQTPLSRDGQAIRIVLCVARAVTAEASGPAAPDSWEVTVFEDDTANAFALPGGKIGVHTGLLEVAATPDQLATVLGHEVGHVLAQHGRGRGLERLAELVPHLVVDPLRALALVHARNPPPRLRSGLV